MFLKHIDLTTALRPSYLPDEVLLFVQDNVGLYEGYVYLMPVLPNNIWRKLKEGKGSTRSRIIRMDKYI
jgi:hypothetical protein